MSVEIKKAIYSYIQETWTASQLIFDQNQSDPACNTYMVVRFMDISTDAGPKNYKNYRGEINFSLFTTEAENIYLLDEHLDLLRNCIENRKISSPPYDIGFREFDVKFLEQSRDFQSAATKVLTYCSIFCSVYITKT